MLRDALENFKFQKSKRLFKDLRFCFSAEGIILVPGYTWYLFFVGGNYKKKKISDRAGIIYVYGTVGWRRFLCGG